MKEFSDCYLEQVHNHSFKNKKEVLESNKCTCFHCFRTYSSKEIEIYLCEKNGEETALCPHCLCDSIIGDASGFELTDTLIDSLADKYFRELKRDDVRDFDGTKIVILD